MLKPKLPRQRCKNMSITGCFCFLMLSVAPLQLGAQVSVRMAVDAMKAFESQYLNTSFRYAVEDVYERGPAWANGTIVETGHGLCKHNQKTGWHHEKDSSLRDYGHCLAYANSEDEDPSELRDRLHEQSGRILTNGSTVNVTVRESGPTLTGTIKSNAGRINWDGRLCMDDLNFLYGFERFLLGCDMRLSDMLSTYDCKVVRDTIDGKESSRVSCSTIMGDLNIWFSTDANPRPLRVEMSRESDHFVMLEPREYRVADITGHCCGDNGPFLTEIVHTFSDLKYREIDGRHFCIGFTFTKQETDADGQEALNVTEVSITDIDLNPPEIKSHSVDFELFTVPEGTRFWADDSPNIPYIVHDKKVAKVVNEKTLESLEGIRFAMPTNRIWWFRVLAILAILITAVFVVKRRWD